MSRWIHALQMVALTPLFLAGCHDEATFARPHDPGSAGAAGVGGDPGMGLTGTGGAGEPTPWVTFVDPNRDFETADVFDSNREIVRFHREQQSMVALSGTSIGGWTADGIDLDWDRNGVAFQVAFGAEAGERRAYFTETATGTICDLVISGPDQLLIYATRELPPQE